VQLGRWRWRLPEPRRRRSAAGGRLVAGRSEAARWAATGGATSWRARRRDARGERRATADGGR